MADQYCDIKVFNVPQAQVDNAVNLINGVDQTGVSISVVTWKPETEVLGIGVGGPNLDAWKTALKAAILAEYGRLPDFEVTREDPDEMDPITRVCTAGDIAQGYNNYVQAFFASDLRLYPAGAYTNWIEAGDRWFRVRTGLNADGTTPTAQEIEDAQTQFAGFPLAYRWRIRLHHECKEKWEHDTIEKLWVYFTNKIPQHRAEDVRAILEPNEFEYAGEHGQDVWDFLEARQVGLASHFFPAPPEY